MKKITAIVLAGGVGARFGADIPKQFVNLNGKPIIAYCLDTFSKHPDISNIIVATHENYMGFVKELCPEAILVNGGESRQNSSLNALKACSKDTDFVLIHDAVRPFIDFKVINRCIKALEEGHIAVDTKISANDTIVQINEENLLTDMPDRRFLFRGQTPQAFQYKAILDAYINPAESKIPPTDDIRYLFNKGIPCYCVEGSDFNIKVTTISDLYLAERIAQKMYQAVPETIELTGKKVLVIGATGGIGKAIAEVLEEKGARVRGVGSGDFNLLNFNKYEEFFHSIRNDFGFVDILINSAGYLEKRLLIDTNFETIKNIIDINLTAPFELTKVAVRTILKEGSSIFHIGSSSWSLGRKEYAAYSSAKAGLVNFVQAMAEELLPLGISINCINPPRTNTKMRQINFPGEDPSTLMDPDTVAREILKYCSSHATGYIIDLKVGIDG